MVGSATSLVGITHEFQYIVFAKETAEYEASFVDTPPKFNSSPLKSYRLPIGKDRLPFPPFFRGENVKLRVRICCRMVWILYFF